MSEKHQSRLDALLPLVNDAWTHAAPGVDSLILGRDIPDLARDFRAVAEALRRPFPQGSFVLWRETGSDKAAATMDDYEAQRKAALALVDAWLNEETP